MKVNPEDRLQSLEDKIAQLEEQLGKKTDDAKASADLLSEQAEALAALNSKLDDQSAKLAAAAEAPAPAPAPEPAPEPVAAAPVAAAEPQIDIAATVADAISAGMQEVKSSMLTQAEEHKAEMDAILRSKGIGTEEDIVSAESNASGTDSEAAADPDAEYKKAFLSHPALAECNPAGHSYDEACALGNDEGRDLISAALAVLGTRDQFTNNGNKPIISNN